jgi:cytochrome c oxidase accessory protein FixG
VPLNTAENPVDISVSEEHDAFRNELASVARDGRRRWIYARKPSGRLYRARTALSWGLLAFLLLAPFITIGGQPLMMLNILERKFVLLGILFRPQDFYLVVLIGLTVLVSVVLSTVVFGRLWCGWLCPQTVFMEMLFRKLEYLIEGSAEQQLRRDRGPWTGEKAFRRGAKHLIFFGLSFVIANVFLAWIIGAPALQQIVTDPPAQHLVGLVAIVIFSLVFYLVFARFREQACVLACPYGRMLSALTDARTITITYDWRRGEPRHRLVRGASEPAGDCIDCHQCVTVCPTGIDIRHGIQLECINCTACIDACNGVMERVGRPLGLIRFTSHQAIAGSTTAAGRLSPLPAAAQRPTSFAARTTRLLRSGVTARSAAYALVWLVLTSSVVVLWAGRRDLDVLILRQPGTLYASVSGGDVANFYTVQALNRTGRTRAFTIEVVEPRGGTVTLLGPLGEVSPYGLVESRVMLRIPPASLAGAGTPVRFAVRVDDGDVQMIESSFVGPVQR